VQLTRDSGKSWNDVTPPGMLDWTKVNTIDAAADDPDTAYVAADRHRLDDRRPLAFRTHDSGKTWTEIGHGLPRDSWVSALRGDPARKGLLYAGTYHGVFVSFDDGETWQSLRLNSPAAVVTDLLVHDDDLIAATQGRALWSLDDLAPLRHATEAAASGGPFLVPPPTAVRLRANNGKDTPLPPEEPRAPNPPVGAVLDYVLAGAPTGPVTLEIADGSGQVLRRFASDEKAEPRPAEKYFADLWAGVAPPPTAHPGHNRFVWDLRLPPPRVLEGEYTIAAIPGKPTPVNPQGAFVLPGRYEVRLLADGVTRRQPLEIVRDPRIDVSDSDLEALLAFQKEVEAALARSADLAEKASASASEAEVASLAATAEETPKAIHGALTSLATDLEGADQVPTGPERELLAFCLRALDRFEAAWKKR
jgi:hypothetical protein